MFPDIAVEFTENPARILLAVALLGASLFLNGWIYFRRKPTSYPYVRRVLLLLRTVTIVLVFFLLLSPTLHIRYVKKVRPYYVLLIDRSLSMDLPVWESSGKPRKRMNRVEEFLMDKGILDRLLSEAEIELLEFSDRPYLSNPESIFLRKKKRSYGTTDLAEALRWAREKYLDADGFIVVTDGRVNSGEDPRLLLSEEIPVYFLGVGQDMGSPDIDIVEAQVPSRIYQGVPLSFSVTLRVLSPAAGTVRLRVEEEGKLIRTLPLKVEPGEFYHDVNFSLTDVEEGRHIYTLVADGLEGERFTENNARNTVVEVYSTWRKALVLSVGPRWDLEFFVRALRRLEYLTVDLFLLSMKTGEGVLFSGDGDDHLGYPITNLDFTGYDLICLQGSLTDIPLHRFFSNSSHFTQAGKGLILLLTDGFERSVVARDPWPDVLPWWTPVSVQAVSGDFDIIPPATDTTGLTRLIPSPEDNLVAWSSLPPIAGRLSWPDPVALKPSLSTLVAVRNEGGKETPAVVVEDKDGFRIISFLGRGFWRWSFHRTSLEDPTFPFGRFIDTLVQWGLDGMGRGEAVQVRPTKKLFLRGENVEFLLRSEKETQGEFFITIHAVDGDEKPEATFTMDLKGEGEKTINIGPLKPGDYRCRYGMGGERSVATTGFFVDGYSKEFSRPEPDDRMMVELAGISGGKYQDIINIERKNLGDVVPLSKIDKSNMSIIVINNSLYYYLLLLFTLIAEIFVRKMKGFP